MRVGERRNKHSVTIYLDYYDNDGKRRQPRIGRAKSRVEINRLRDQAALQARMIQAELEAKKHKPKCGEMLVATAWDEHRHELELAGRRQNYLKTNDNIRKRFTAFCQSRGVRKLRDVTPAIVADWLNTMRVDGYKPNTIALSLAVLAGFMNYCVRSDKTADNPCGHPLVKRIQPATERHERTFTADQLGVFLDGALNHCRRGSNGKTASERGRAYHDFYLFLSETGLRSSEALNIRWCDLSFQGGWVHVVPHDGWMPKTRRSERHVPLTPRIAAMLTERKLAARGFDLANVWPVTWTVTAMSSLFANILRRVGFADLDGRGQRFTVHSLRHYYGSQLAMNGADPATVRDLMGHESISTTNRYFQVPAAHAFDAVQRAFGGQNREVESDGKTELRL